MSTLLSVTGSSSLAIAAAAIIVKVTLLIAVGAIAALGLRGASAAVRHLVWSLTLAGAVALVLFAPVAPEIDVRMPIAPQVIASAPATPVIAGVPAPSASSGSMGSEAVATVSPVAARTLPSRYAATTKPIEPARLAFFTWLTGCIAVLTWSVLGHAALARLARKAAPLDDPEWHSLLASARNDVGITRHVALLESGAVRTPVTWGLLHPAILLPAGASNWTSERKRVVILHELAHVARLDYLSQLLGTIACALFWFHPAIWVAARRLRVEAERACDDQVLHAGLPGIDYASHLLDVARRMKAMRLIGPAAVGMARPSHLEERLLAVLSATPSRRPVASRTARAAIAATLALVLVVAGIRPSIAAPVTAPPAQKEAGNEAAKEESASVSPERQAVRHDTDSARTVSVPSASLDTATPAPKVSSALSVPSRTANAALPQQDFDFQDSVAASPDGDLDLDLRTGAGLVITGWDRPWIRVRGTLGGPDAYRTRVSLSSRTRGALLRTSLSPGDGNSSTSHKFEIMVPRKYNIRLSSAGGGLSLTDVEGRFRGTTGGGALNLDRLTGSASLSTGGGDIRVTDSDLSGRVSTGGGSVVLSAVKGGLRGSSGSGPIVYSEDDDGNAAPLGDVTINGERISGASGSGSGRGAGASSGSGRGRGESSAGGGSRGGGRGSNWQSKYTSDWDSDFGANSPAPRLNIRKAGGSIDLEEAPEGAIVSTGGGDVRVGPSSGVVDAHTGGGDIELGPVSGSARAITGAGDVRVTIVNADGQVHDVDVSSGNGIVTLILPADLDARLELETAYTNNHSKKTRIVSDFRLDQDETTEWNDDYGTPRKFVTGTATFGKGTGLIRVRTVNGDITIRRGSK